MENLKKHSKFIMVFVALLITYIPAFLWMWERWFAADSYYSHGILIPFVVGYLIWQQRAQLEKITVRCSRWGLVLIVTGLIIHLMSSILRIYFTSGFSMLMVIFGLVLHFYGRKIFRVIIFPLSFLFFMIPLPMVVIVNISFKMKLFAAKIAAMVLNGMDIYAVQKGSVITMRHTQVIVDDVCSGLRSLISLMALGSICAYWLNGSMYKKIILFILTVPIAILTNVARVLILSLVSEIWGVEYAQGFFHDATGFLVFALAFVLLHAAGKVIE